MCILLRYRWWTYPTVLNWKHFNKKIRFKCARNSFVRCYNIRRTLPVNHTLTREQGKISIITSPDMCILNLAKNGTCVSLCIRTYSLPMHYHNTISRYASKWTREPSTHRKWWPTHSNCISTRRVQIWNLIIFDEAVLVLMRICFEFSHSIYSPGSLCNMQNDEREFSIQERTPI